MTHGEAEARGGQHWPSHTEGQSQLWDRPQVCRPSWGALGSKETRDKEKGLLCVGTGVASLKCPQAHAGHRHRPLGWPLCSLGSAQAALPAPVSPASTSSLWGCRLASVWRPSLDLSGLVRCGPPWGSPAPYFGGDGRGKPAVALARGKRLGGDINSLLIAIPTQPLRPVQGAECISQPPPPLSPGERPEGGGNLCKAGPRLAILGARSASCLCLPAALRMNRPPAWGSAGTHPLRNSLPRSDKGFSFCPNLFSFGHIVLRCKPASELAGRLVKTRIAGPSPSF